MEQTNSNFRLLSGLVVAGLIFFSAGLALAENGGSAADSSVSVTSSSDSATGGSSNDTASSGGIVDVSHGDTSSSVSKLKTELERERSSSQASLSKIDDQIKSIEQLREATTSQTYISTLSSQIRTLEIQKEREKNTQAILKDTADVSSGDVSRVLANVGTSTRSHELEVETYGKYSEHLVGTSTDLSKDTVSAITNFVAYGSQTTADLGQGERAGVIDSYKDAFGHVPSTQTEWADAIKIANGRWPNEQSQEALTKAEAAFKEVYKREANLNDAHDNAAVSIIAYGLRPNQRNLESESAAMTTFKATYRHEPKTAMDWDIVRAIAYSGSTR
jgi:hypothetical protein